MKKHKTDWYIIPWGIAVGIIGMFSSSLLVLKLFLGLMVFLVVLSVWLNIILQSRISALNSEINIILRRR